MEELTRFLASCEFASPLYFWMGSALVLLLIFFPLFRKRRGLRLDLKYWKGRVEFKGERVWVLWTLIAITSLLMATVLTNPRILTRQSVPIYGKPVMAVIDVSGSMEYRGRPGKEGPSSFEKARNVFYDLLDHNIEADLGLLLYSTEHYIARYFAPKNELLKDTLENTEEVSFISTGTRTAEALAKARRFFSENTEAKDKAIVLISDLEAEPEAILETAEEMERYVWAGIKIYVIFIEREKRSVVAEKPRQLQPTEGVKMVGMNDKDGIDQICAEVAAMESSPVRGEEMLLRKSLIPFLVPPILGLITLCLILSETRFRKIP